MKSSYAIISITRHGCQLGLEISKKMSGDLSTPDLYFPEKFQNDFVHNTTGASTPQFYRGKVKDLLGQIFDKYERIIAIISLGALIRLITPLLGDKKTDPAVVVIDENGEFVISVLSGHLGGANDLARLVAEKIGARPVITTASDVRKTIAVDLLGKSFHWVMEDSEFLTEISAAVVNDEPVAIVQESGETNWPPHDHPLAENIFVCRDVEGALKTGAEYFIVISHREFLDLPEYAGLLHKKTVLFRPKVIGIGLGCNRNTSEKEIEEVVRDTFHELKFKFSSLRGVGSIDLKSDEPGLVSFCTNHGIVPVFYPADELNRVKMENPSGTVFKYTGAYGVSEPAARLLTRNDDLVLTKKVSGNVTISVGLYRLF
jgi:cobalt-precorrin 5A hydrolase